MREEMDAGIQQQKLSNCLKKAIKQKKRSRC